MLNAHTPPAEIRAWGIPDAQILALPAPHQGSLRKGFQGRVGRLKGQTLAGLTVKCVRGKRVLGRQREGLGIGSRGQGRAVTSLFTIINKGLDLYPYSKGIKGGYIIHTRKTPETGLFIGVGGKVSLVALASLERKTEP